MELGGPYPMGQILDLWFRFFFFFFFFLFRIWMLIFCFIGRPSHTSLVYFGNIPSLFFYLFLIGFFIYCSIYLFLFRSSPT